MDTGFLPDSTSTVFLETGSLLSLDPTNLARLAGQQPQGSSDPPASASPAFGLDSHTDLFVWVLGSEHRVFLVRQALTDGALDCAVLFAMALDTIGYTITMCMWYPHRHIVEPRERKPCPVHV